MPRRYDVEWKVSAEMTVGSPEAQAGTNACRPGTWKEHKYFSRRNKWINLLMGNSKLLSIFTKIMHGSTAIISTVQRETEARAGK